MLGAQRMFAALCVAHKRKAPALAHQGLHEIDAVIVPKEPKHEQTSSDRTPLAAQFIDALVNRVISQQGRAWLPNYLTDV